MKVSIKVILVFFISTQFLNLSAQDHRPYVSHTYKATDSVELKMNIYYPDGEIPIEPLPAIVFFFGGGWVNGNPGHFASQCQYLASRGIIAIAADYRTKSRHETTPLECIADAKSAIRWIRSNSSNLSINPDMLAAAGGSAGGHLAVSSAVIKDFDDPNDDISISPIPNALILFNPVISTYIKGYGIEKLGEHAKAASPLHQLEPGLPPTLIFHGTDDELVSIESIRAFTEKAKKLGDECILMEFTGRGHGFFNKQGDDTKDYWATVLETEKFLINRKFLPSKLANDSKE
jgi:acetyl esterase